MDEPHSTLTACDRQSLFAACSREAKRIGGDDRSAEYFFVRAQSSRVWCGTKGAVTVADMDIGDWCDAIAWSAPGMGKPPKRAGARPSTQDTEHSTKPYEPEELRKQPRSGAKSKRASGGAA